MRNLPILSVLLAFCLTTGCSVVREIEQWKCDKLGLCHFAPRKPGAYNPQLAVPGYAPPVSQPMGVYPNNPVPITGYPMAPAAGASANPNCNTYPR